MSTSPEIRRLLPPTVP